MDVFFFVPLVIVVAFVLPLWLVLHYIGKWRSRRMLSTEDQQILEEIWRSAQRLEDRIETLERIVLSDVQTWKSDDKSKI
ncbi:MAG: envelope stress response membrane protein PspB [Pseudomonadota bacterium]